MGRTDIPGPVPQGAYGQVEQEAGHRMGGLSELRRLKHRIFLARKKIQTYLRYPGLVVAGAAYRLRSRILPFRYRPDRYPHSFLAMDAPVDGPIGRVDARIFVVWSGANEIPEPRRVGIESIIQQNIGFEVVLVTPDNLHEWESPEFPLHPAYQGLSYVHRADYLRGYLLHVHGGAYVDIKRQKGPLAPHVEVINASKELWLGSYPEIYRGGIAAQFGALDTDVRVHHRRVMGQAVIITKPCSPFTTEWMQEVHRRLDYYRPALERFPGNARGTNPGYPIPWFGLLAEIIQPLSLKYQNHLHLDDAMWHERFGYQ